MFEGRDKGAGGNGAKFGWKGLNNNSLDNLKKNAGALGSVKNIELNARREGYMGESFIGRQSPEGDFEKIGSNGLSGPNKDKASDSYLENRVENHRNFYNYVSKKQKYGFKEQIFGKFVKGENYESGLEIDYKSGFKNNLTPTSVTPNSCTQQRVKTKGSLLSFNDKNYECMNKDSSQKYFPGGAKKIKNNKSCIVPSFSPIQIEDSRNNGFRADSFLFEHNNKGTKAMCCPPSGIVTMDYHEPYTKVNQTISPSHGNLNSTPP